MTSAERPDTDALEQRREIIDTDDVAADDVAEVIEPDAELGAEVGPEVDAADAAEQRRPAGAAGADEDYPA
jgi:hypothetical protein